ncbi:MAG: cysteine synthase A [Clostridia bacterium]|nr:cysteine synthase A [Clostridia bacterium]
MIYSSALDLVGNTPLVELQNIEKEFSLKGKLLAKLELFNPAGSSKDRIAKHVILQGLSDGTLNKNSVIIEATSGNTGIGIAMVCAALSLKAVIVMPDTMSKERIEAISAFGASVVLSDGAKGMQGAVEKAEEIQKNTPDSIILGQFVNSLNPQAHFETTGKEIWQDTCGEADVFVAGIGTGGTISGVGKFLKENKKDILIVGVEPESSPLITKGVSGSHKIQGIGANFIPNTYDASVVDAVETVSDEDAYKFTKILAHKEGILAGISSGAALSKAVELAKKDEFTNKTIVVLLADTGTRYFSTGVFEK